MKKKKRAALYARVSTGPQQTIGLQLGDMRRFVKARGWTVVLEQREVASGSLDKRPRREEILRAARQQAIDVVVVWRLDRWGRSVSDLALTLKDLHELGIAFVSITEGIDLTTSAGRAMAGMLSVFSEFEREIGRERILAGQAAARKRGVHMGRPNVAKAHQAQMRTRYRDGATISAIAREFNVSRSTVRVYLA